MSSATTDSITTTTTTPLLTFQRPSVGSSLTEADYANLQRRWITRELALQAGLRRVDSPTGADYVGRRDGHGTYAGILIPYTWPGTNGVREYRLRRDQPDFEYRNGQRKEAGKYLGPPGKPSLVYLPPGVTADKLASTDVPLIITEGEFKTLALSRLAKHDVEVDKLRFLPVGLAGVWNWRGTIGKTSGPNGERRDVKGIIVDLEKVTWAGRRVIIAFDADAKENASVSAARSQLARELRTRGAVVAYLEWELREGKGVDDLIASVGPAQVLEIIESVDFTTPAERYGWHDAGNGDRLADAYGADLIYCCERKGYMVWTGTHFAHDEFVLVERMAERVIRDAYAEAGQIKDEQKRNQFLKFLNKSLQRMGISNMVHSAKRKVAQASINDFDIDPTLLNFRNVTVELVTGEPREHRREDRISKCIPFDYDPNAECPTFMSFLFQIMGSHPDASEPELELVDRRVEHLQRAFGCAATGKPEKVLPVLYGEGNNGKTTLIEIIREALGDHEYAGEIQIESLMARSKEVVGSNNVNADLADLKGCRFVSSSEPEQGQRLNLSRVKYLTGCGQVRARYLGENFFTFRPTHKIFLDCNHKPVITSPNDAVWNRLIVVPFTVTIEADDIDTELPTKLRSELPGIAQWLVQGAKAYLKSGLLDLPVIQQATKAYQDESDRLTEFLADRCVVRAGAWAGLAEIWKEYQRWVEDTGERYALAKAVFDDQLQRHGCVKGKDVSGNKRIWKGVGLLAAPEQAERAGAPAAPSSDNGQITDSVPG